MSNKIDKKQKRVETTREKKEEKLEKFLSNHKEPLEIYHVIKFCRD